MSHFVKRSVSFIAAMVLTLVLFGCNTSHDPATDLSSLGKYIDPEIQGEERAVMLQVLFILPERSREDVVHFSEDGKVYTNRVANKGTMQLWHKVDEKNSIWKNESSNLRAFPVQRQRPNCDEGHLTPLAPVTPSCGLDGTGIEFRMQTKAGLSSSTIPGLSYASVRVTLPSRKNSEILVDDPTGYYQAGRLINYNCTRDIQKGLGALAETPYIYLGGWGASGYASRVDAGFQWNCGDAADDYSLFFLREDAGISTDSFANRFAAGQAITLEFSVQDNPNKAGTSIGDNIMYITAGGLNRSRTGTIVKTFSTSNVPGWTPTTGKDHIVSLSSSLAQNPNSGAGKYNKSGSKFVGVYFDSMKIGLTKASAVPWNGLSTSDPLTGGAPCKMPSTGAITVTGSSISSNVPARVDIVAQ
jgi:hypothetical protein